MGTSAISCRHRPPQPVRDTCGSSARRPAAAPSPFITTGTTSHVAAQHPQRLRSRYRPTEVQTRRTRPVLQILQPDQQVHVRAVAAGFRDVAVVEDISAHIRQRLGLPLSGADRSSSPVNGLARASITAAIASNIAASSNRPLIFPPPSGERVKNSSLTGAGRPVVGCLAVLIQQLHQRLAPLVQLRAEWRMTAFDAQLGLDTGPLLPGTAARAAFAAEHPGDHLDVPQARPPRSRTPRRSPAAAPAAPTPSSPTRAVPAARRPRRGAGPRGSSQPSRSARAAADDLYPFSANTPRALQRGHRGNGRCGRACAPRSRIG